ncbi:hypothetical protein D3C77_641710 [compost metagenome]
MSWISSGSTACSIGYSFHCTVTPQLFRYSKAARPMDGMTTGSYTPCRHSAGMRCWLALSTVLSVKVGA